MEETPIFSNTCGKIYADNVIFAFSNGEKNITTSKITAAKFSERPTQTSLLLAALPFPLLILVYLEKSLPDLIQFGGAAILLAVCGIIYYYGSRKYRISLSMTDGSKFNISVAKDNRKDAKKFVDNLKKNADL